MKNTFLHFVHHIKEKLWFRPLLYCFISIACALLAQLADHSGLGDLVPKIKIDSLESLLKTISASMLVISTFAVGSMISAFSVASTTATPRSFKLVVSDDVSQNALSAFIGSFIFSVVAQVAMNNGYYGKAGVFTLFGITILIFIVVILTFLRWVDRISRLGRLGNTIEIIEQATQKSIRTIKASPYFKSNNSQLAFEKAQAIYASSIGYVQTIDLDALQNFAAENEVLILLNCQPGTFVATNEPIAFLNKSIENKDITSYFIVEHTRSFEEDPRFGLIALSEIASRALSPAVNDPGTAIAILGSYIRLFSLWSQPVEESENMKNYTCLSLPVIKISDLFADAFRPVARDGASNIEVMIRLQKSLEIIANVGSDEMKKNAVFHSQQAYKRATKQLVLSDDLDNLKQFCLSGHS